MMDRSICITRKLRSRMTHCRHILSATEYEIKLILSTTVLKDCVGKSFYRVPQRRKLETMFAIAHHLQRRSMTARRAITGLGPLFIFSRPFSIAGRHVFGSPISSINTPLPLYPSPRLMSSKVNSTQKNIVSNAAKTRAGSGKVATGAPYIKNRGPVSWPSLFLVGIAAASVVAYYNIERERRLESAMGRVVSSESDGWSPNPDVMAPRKFKLTPWGYFPEDDGFGPCKFVIICLV